MPNTARRANGIATRSRLLETATQLFAAGGYAGTSLRQIAAAAGVDLATLKYHFQDKPTLFAEVYRAGHEVLLGTLHPIVEALASVETTEALRSELQSVFGTVLAYLNENEDFVRMTIYRMLERPAEVIALEQKLEEEMLAVVESAVARLESIGIVRVVDTRALVVLLVTALPTWWVSVRSRPGWLGATGLDSEKRFVTFFVDLMERQLLSPY